MTPLNDAIRYLEGGDWEAAHAIVQNDSTPGGNWAHGIVHIMEGDLRNAAYWYRRAGRQLPGDGGRRLRGRRRCGNRGPKVSIHKLTRRRHPAQ